LSILSCEWPEKFAAGAMTGSWEPCPIWAIPFVTRPWECPSPPRHRTSPEAEPDDHMEGLYRSAHGHPVRR
jgi:hypothetical protein